MGKVAIENCCGFECNKRAVFHRGTARLSFRFRVLVFEDTVDAGYVVLVTWRDGPRHLVLALCARLSSPTPKLGGSHGEARYYS
jgi:hypothetical protein